MKTLAKLLAVGALLTASAPLALAAPITGTIGFTGLGSYNQTTGAFTASNPNFVLVGGAPGTSLATFTLGNLATFFNFNTNALGGGGAPVFLTAESGVTLSFKLTGMSAVGNDPAGPGFTGTGILSETGFDDTLSTFTLNTNSSAGTIVTFNAITPTPEPSSLMLMGTGLVGAAGMLVRRRRQTVA